MFKWLKEKPAVHPAPPPAEKVQEQAAALDAAYPYPSVDPGILIKDADTMLAANQDMMDRIKLAYGCDRPTFERDIVRVTRRLADYVNLMPATPDNYFREPGGLFRMCLEIAFYALQATDSQIFEGRATISGRRMLEPRWRLATFIAGLCAELHRTLSQVTIRDSKGEEWPYYLFGLTDWLATRQVDRFFLRWTLRADENRTPGLLVLPLVIDRTLVHYLAQGNSIIVPHMMASLSGMASYREPNVLDELVRRSTALVIDQNLQAAADRYGKPTLGAHLERYLLDAMRRLVAGEAAWQPNVKRSRLWYGLDGIYMLWPGALADVGKVLESDQLPGIPRSPDTILEVLIEAGVVVPRSGTGATWMIYPPGSARSTEAVMLSGPAVLFGALAPPPRPMDIRLREPRQGDIDEDGDGDEAGATAPNARGGKGAHRHPDREHDGAAGHAAPLPAHARREPGELAAALGRRGEARPRGARPAATPGAQGTGTAPEVQAPPAADTGGHPGGEAARHEPESSMESPGAASDPDAAPAHQPRRQVALQVPLGLSPMVAVPLRALVDDYNVAGQTRCRTVACGLFVPLTELQRCGLDQGIALRALTQCGMLVPDPGGAGPVHVHEFHGHEVSGLVLSPAFVAGLDPTLFEGPADAASRL